MLAVSKASDVGDTHHQPAGTGYYLMLCVIMC